MKLDTSKIYNKTSLDINCFNGNVIYHYSKDGEQVVISHLENSISDETFSIDANSYNIIKNQKECDLTYDSTSKTLFVKVGRKTIKLPTFDNILPSFNLDNLQTIKVATKPLKKALTYTSDSEARPVLTAVNVSTNGNIKASDSMVIYKYVNEDDSKDTTSINICKKFINLIDCKDEYLDLSFNESLVLASIDNIDYIGKLIMGSFPKLDSIDNIINVAPTTITYKVDELKSIVNYGVSSIGKDISSKNTIIHFTKDKIETLGLFESIDEITGITENDYEFYCDAKNLQVVLNSIETEDVNLLYTEPLKPLGIKDEKETIIFAPIRF